MRTRSMYLAVAIVLIAAFVFVGFQLAKTQPSSPSSQPPRVPTVYFGRRTQTQGCKPYGLLPDPECSPGDLMGVTKEQVCVQGYATRARRQLGAVTSIIKRQVYPEYGITHHGRGEYEVDHVVSLELGGSNDIANLWPEPATPVPGFHQKDGVENYLHARVCNGQITLHDAQIIIATNWRKVYEQIPTG